MVVSFKRAFRPEKFAIWQRSASPLTRRFAPTSPRKERGEVTITYGGITQLQDPTAAADDRGTLRNTLISAACLGIVWPGDVVLYVVLPLYAADFGLDALAVGLLLSINRVVRIFGYGWVSPLARRYGAKALTATACLAAAVSTLGYGLLGGFVLLFAARVLWGGAWGVINLMMNAYAYGDGRNAGSRVGLSRAVSSVGAFLSLVFIGPLCLSVGPHQAFTIYGLLGLAAFPLALALSPTVAEPSEVRAPRRWIPSDLNILFFVLALAADGVLGATVSLLLSVTMPAASAIVGASLLLAFQRLAHIVLALFSGPVADRIGAGRLLLPCSLVVACGLGAIALGHVYTGTIIVIISRALLTTVSPVLAAQRSPDRIGALASFATWSDVGLAAGAFLGTVGISALGLVPTYATLAVLVAGMAVFHHFRAASATT
jgi:DHA1 family inner membrane transport protein